MQPVTHEVIVRGRNIEVSSRFRDHVQEKLTKVERFGIPVDRIDVELSQEKNPRQADRAFKVEITCRRGGPVIRAEASAADKYAALELAYTRLEERIRRASERKRFHRHGRGATLSAAEVALLDLDLGRAIPAPNGSATEGTEATATPYDLPDDPSVVFEDGPVLVREKVHESEPMTVEQALHEMELVGHDFFLFLDSGCGRASVVYRRRGFQYGLIRLGAQT